MSKISKRVMGLVGIAASAFMLGAPAASAQDVLIGGAEPRGTVLMSPIYRPGFQPLFRPYEHVLCAPTQPGYFTRPFSQAQADIDILVATRVLVKTSCGH